MNIQADAANLCRDLCDRSLELSASELLSIKNSADVISHIIRVELDSRAARMVDEACALKEAVS